MNSVEKNKKSAWESFIARRLRLESRPFKASIELSRNCNFKCNMCPQSWNPQYEQYHPEFNMTPALFRRVAEELFPHLEYAHLQGYGESVISPYWLEILELCRPFAQRIQFGLVTNLGRRHPEMWRTMTDLNFNIIASIDGATKKTFEAIREGSDFGMILENLEVLLAARRKMGKGALVFAATLQKLNYREMPDLVELARRYGAAKVTYSTVMEPGPLSQRLTRPSSLWDRLRKTTLAEATGHVRALVQDPSGRLKVLGARLRPRLGLDDVPQDELAALKTETLRRAREAKIRVTFNDARLEALGSPPLSKEPAVGVATPLDADYAAGIAESVKVSVQQRCFKPYSYVVVNYRGDIGLCNHLISDGGWKQMGSLQGHSFEEIWNSPVYLEMRRKLLEARPDNDSCRWCFAHRLTE